MSMQDSFPETWLSLVIFLSNSLRNFNNKDRGRIKDAKPVFSHWFIDLKIGVDESLANWIEKLQQNSPHFVIKILLQYHTSSTMVFIFRFISEYHLLDCHVSWHFRVTWSCINPKESKEWQFRTEAFGLSRAGSFGHYLILILIEN